MTRWLGLVLAAASLDAAVIRGSVVNYDGGEALSHAEVTLKAIAGSGGSTKTAHTDSFGNFTFSPVSAGAYLVSATRQYAVAALYGQKRWNSAGTPVTVEANDTLTLSIRLHRFGAITGRVAEENDVGIPGHEVVAYRDAKPPQAVAHAATDDYGRYRLYGLTPGTYLVRSAAKTVDGVGYLPAFAPSAPEADQGRRVEVQLDLDSSGIDVHPMQGRLYQVAGQVSGGAPAELTLAGEAGRQTITVSGAFRFDPVPPGRYELYGTAPADSPSPMAAAHIYLPVDRDISGLAVVLRWVQPTRIEYSQPAGGTAPYTGNIALLARRVDLAGARDIVNLGPRPTSAVLGPGQWELLLQHSAGSPATGSSPTGAGSGLSSQSGGWYRFMAGDVVWLPAPSGSGSLGGIVVGPDRIPVVGAPVYLEVYERRSKTRVGELRTVNTNARGAYQFTGLAPGQYRVLATFEYVAPDTATMELCGAQTVNVGPSDPQTLDLDLFTLP